MRITLVLALLLTVAHVVSAETKYIPYISQGPEWSTAFHIHNMCDKTSSYEVILKDSYGKRTEFTSADKVWTGFYYDPTSGLGPKQSSYLYFPPEREVRHGYAEVVDDGDGCVATDVYYVNHFPGDKFWYVQANPKPQPAAGVVVPFAYYEGCDARMIVVGVGENVSLEAVGVQGNVLGRAELENVFQQSFMLSDKFPAAAGEYGSLRISGKATALGLNMCDYPEPGGPKQLHRRFSTHPIPGDGPPADDEDPPDDEDDPSGATYIIESFSTKLLSQEDGRATYAYKLTIRNPTRHKQNYGFTARFRDSDGFAVESVLIDYAVIVAARQTRTFEGTFGVYLPQDPSAFTVELSVESHPVQEL